ncbi:MAG: RNA polymerase sigma factor RpoD/SigA [Bacteroidota bacterium]
MKQLRILKQITRRENQSTEKYLQDVKTLPRISAEEEVELAKRIKAGDQMAKEHLILANLRFVISVAKQYPSSQLTLNDLINEGNIGLIIAAERFDETRGFKFISYAVWWVRQRIMQAIQEKGRFIRIPLNRATAIQRVYKARRKLTKELQREPTLEELTEYLDMPMENIASILQTNVKTLSMDAPLAQEDSNTLLEVLKDDTAEAPDTNLNEESTKEEISRLLSKLDPRAREILICYFGLSESGKKERKFEMTLEEIGIKMNLTRERVRQIKEKALRELRMMAQ